MAASESGRPPLRLLVVAILIVAPIVVGLIYGLSTAILVLAALTLAGVILLLWSSVQSLTGEAPMTLDEALSLAAPSAEEERKRAVLRALQDLKYERSVGKVSEEDYQQLSARYRSEAKELLRTIDAARERGQDHVEQLLKKRQQATSASSKEWKPRPERPAPDSERSPESADDSNPPPRAGEPLPEEP